MTKDKWDTRFFGIAQLVASWSEDNSRKIGAVVVGSANQILSTGYNGFPRGVKASDQARHSSKDREKYFWFEHAERNAIYNAARNGIALEGSFIYSTLFPCADCARAIVQCGMSELITSEPPTNDPTYQRSFEVSLDILLEGGVKVRYVNR